MDGTHYFMSPETFTYCSTAGIDGDVVDIWALGVTFFCFVFMELPFFDESLEDLIEKI